MDFFARTRALLVAIGLLAFAGGCASISDSVTSPSRWVADSSEASADSSGASADSSNNSSQSSSGSSEDEEETSAEAAYRDDVRVATRTLATSGAIDAQLSSELSRIALEHDISDWEGHAGTWIAVGSGLREAGLSANEAQGTLASVGRFESRERDLMIEGFGADL